jgi:hypothetical protein
MASCPEPHRCNQSLLSIERAERVLGYVPVPGGRYIDEQLVW